MLSITALRSLTCQIQTAPFPLSPNKNPTQTRKRKPSESKFYTLPPAPFFLWYFSVSISPDSSSIIPHPSLLHHHRRLNLPSKANPPLNRRGVAWGRRIQSLCERFDSAQIQLHFGVLSPFHSQIQWVIIFPFVTSLFLLVHIQIWNLIFTIVLNRWFKLFC